MRGMLLVPWVIPPAMSTLAWLWLFDPSTVPSTIVGGYRCRSDSMDRRDRLARSSVILVNVGSARPFFMIMYLAALKSVPDQLIEPAAIDGANWWQRIWYVTLPMMRNIIAITTLFSLIVQHSPTSTSCASSLPGAHSTHPYLCDMGVPHWH